LTRGLSRSRQDRANRGVSDRSQKNAKSPALRRNKLSQSVERSAKGGRSRSEHARKAGELGTVLSSKRSGPSRDLKRKGKNLERYEGITSSGGKSQKKRLGRGRRGKERGNLAWTAGALRNSIAVAEEEGVGGCFEETLPRSCLRSE